MHNTSTWMLCLSTILLATGESAPGILKDPSFLRLLNKQYSVVRLPKTQWSFRPQEDSYPLGSSDASHGYTSYSSYGSTSKERETSTERPLYSGSSQDFWRPSSTNLSFASLNHQSYSRPYLGSYYQDTIPRSPSTYQYLQTRPTTGSHSSFKKTPTYHVKGKLHVQNFDALGKLKYKKTVPHLSPLTNQKSVYPRVHKPYAKHKYPAQKTVHPFFKRYYRSPYQRYSIPSAEILRYRINAHNDDYRKTSFSSPTPTPDKYYTTERMDDTYPDASATSEDYSVYNDTRHNEAGGNYYETYEEVEKTTSEPEESSYDESATRGYYGDRIYMSTQTPLVISDRTSVKNKYFIIRRTSNDDDIETIFE